MEKKNSVSTENNQMETKLRSVIRESIKLYAIKKNNLSARRLQEEKLREVIRNVLIKEGKKMLAEKQSKDPAPASTLEGVMRTLLNNIIPQIRLDYIRLQTNQEEREGFKDYFYNAVEKIIQLSLDQRNAEEQPEELEEQDKITLKSDDPDFIAGVADGTEEDTSKNGKKSNKKSTKDITSYFERGQNFGQKTFNSIKDRIENVVFSEIVPEEYPEFTRVLNANFKSWFAIWDQNRTQDQGIPEIPDQETPPPEQALPAEEPAVEEPATGEVPPEETAPAEPTGDSLQLEDFEIELE